MNEKYEAGALSKLLNPNAPIPTTTTDEPSSSTSTKLELVEKKRLIIPSKRKNKRTMKVVDTTDAKNKSTRTIFIGNVPIETNEKTLKQEFRRFGAIESVRFRSVAFENPKLPRKASFIKGEFHRKRTSCNAYVVYKNESSVTEAIQHNGMLFNGNHLRIDYETPTINSNCSIFLGNLPYDVSEEAIRSFFKSCGTIVNVRLIRERSTNVGKGIGFVTMDNVKSMKKALLLNSSEFCGRVIRITKAVDTDKIARAKSKSKYVFDRKRRKHWVSSAKTKKPSLNLSRVKKRTKPQSNKKRKRKKP